MRNFSNTYFSLTNLLYSGLWFTFGPWQSDSIPTLSKIFPCRSTRNHLPGTEFHRLHYGLLLHLPVLLETFWSFSSWDVIIISWISFFLSDCFLLYSFTRMWSSISCPWSLPLCNVISFQMTPQTHSSISMNQPVCPIQSQILRMSFCRWAWNLGLATAFFLFKWSHLHLVTKFYFLLLLLLCLRSLSPFHFYCFRTSPLLQQTWLSRFLFSAFSLFPTLIPFIAQSF